MLHYSLQKSEDRNLYSKTIKWTSFQKQETAVECHKLSLALPPNTIQCTSNNHYISSTYSSDRDLSSKKENWKFLNCQIESVFLKIPEHSGLHLCFSFKPPPILLFPNFLKQKHEYETSMVFSILPASFSIKSEKEKVLIKTKFVLPVGNGSACKVAKA